jgi:hypothetical protein
MNINGFTLVNKLISVNLDSNRTTREGGYAISYILKVCKLEQHVGRYI